MERLVAGMDVTVDSLETENRYDNAKDFEIRLTATAKRRCSSTPQGLGVRLPALWESFLLQGEPTPDRTSPFEINFPLQLASPTTFVGGQDDSWMETGPLSEKGVCSGVKWQCRASVDKARLQLHFLEETTPGLYPKEQYAEYQRTGEKGLQSMGRDVVIHHVEPTSAPTTSTAPAK